MLVVGVDPGTKFIGLCWIRWSDERGVSRNMTFVTSGLAFPRRYIEFQRKLESFFLSCPERPVMVAIEQASPEGNPKRLQARTERRLEGVYAVCIAETARCFSDTPLVWVRYRTWTGGQGKQDVYKRLAEKYSWKKLLKFRRDDEADALGVADFAFESVRKK